MSSQALQNLNFIVSMIDKVSGPAGKMMKTMDTVTTRIQTGYKKIGYGVAGVVGSGYALNRLITPAKELDRALGEVRSLDVTNDVLNKLTQSSLKFSTTYGESAIDFVRSSYDIQSAISGLVGNELATFTEASAILAKGTKADTSTITNFVGTMYGIFKTNADIMGKGRWVEQLAGQTAAAVQMFKTTGAEMSGAFSTTGASAVSHGILMNEQIAILGTLQATMSGTEAGTKYKSFLAGVGKAQKSLGLTFTDSQGKMLPMIQILERIKGKFGDIDTVAESDLLQKAFGRKEAVDLIKLLSTDISGLNKNIASIGNQKGMDKAIAMANAMKDPWQVAGKQVEGIMIVLGKAMMPTLLPFLDLLGEGAQGILRWTQLFPNLTRWVGIGVVGIIGLVAAFSTLSIIVGINTFVMAGWTLAMSAMKIAFIAMKFSLLTMIPSVWAFNAALFANPITWIVAGVVALVAVVIAAVVYWDTWTTAVVNFGAAIIETLKSFGFVNDVLALWDKLPQWWAKFSNYLTTLDPFSFVGDSIDWILNKINLIPGINISQSIESPKPIPGTKSLNPNAQSAGSDGVINKISNANNANNNRSIGDINISNFGQAMSGQTFADELEFAAP